MDRVRPVEWLVGGSIAVCAVIALAILTAPLWPWRKVVDHQGLAAWVQSIGSIAAILVAFALPAYQRRIEKREEAAKLLDAARIAARGATEQIVDAIALVGQALRRLREAGDSVHPEEARLALSRLELLQRPEPLTLQQLAVVEPDGVEWFLRASRVVNTCRSVLLETEGRGLDYVPDAQHHPIKLLESAQKCLYQAQVLVDGVLMGRAPGLKVLQSQLVD